MPKRGRPKGHKLSQESKDKIAKSKTGQKHRYLTKRKISRSVKRWFKTSEGRAQIEKNKECANIFWSSEDGLRIREEISSGLKELHKIND